MSEYFDRQGQPMESLAFMERFGDLDYKRVALDVVGDAKVSTVWLGLDHNFSDEGPPLIFESMVFGGDEDGEQRRYATEEEALAGHASLVAELQGTAV